MNITNTGMRRFSRSQGHEISLVEVLATTGPKIGWFNFLVSIQKPLSYSCAGATKSNCIKYSLCISFYLLLPNTFTEAIGKSSCGCVVVMLGSGGTFVVREGAVSIVRNHRLRVVSQLLVTLLEMLGTPPHSGSGPPPGPIQFSFIHNDDLERRQRYRPQRRRASSANE